MAKKKITQPTNAIHDWLGVNFCMIADANNAPAKTIDKITSLRFFIVHFLSFIKLIELLKYNLKL